MLNLWRFPWSGWMTFSWWIVHCFSFLSGITQRQCNESAIRLSVSLFRRRIIYSGIELHATCLIGRMFPNCNTETSWMCIINWIKYFSSCERIDKSWSGSICIETSNVYTDCNQIIEWGRVCVCRRVDDDHHCLLKEVLNQGSHGLIPPLCPFDHTCSETHLNLG